MSEDTAPPEDPAALTTYIETRYHERHREELPELTALSAKVEQVHAGAAHVPAGLSEVLKKLNGEMAVHMKKEELLLFPQIRRGGSPNLATQIGAMRADHDDQEAEIAKIRALTDDLTLPSGACRKWTALYEGLDRFVIDLAEHTRLENDVLFPQFESTA